jgi:hypothetical protein
MGDIRLAYFVKQPRHPERSAAGFPRAIAQTPSGAESKGLCPEYASQVNTYSFHDVINPPRRVHDPRVNTYADFRGSGRIFADKSFYNLDARDFRILHPDTFFSVHIRVDPCNPRMYSCGSALPQQRDVSQVEDTPLHGELMKAKMRIPPILHDVIDRAATILV